MSAGPGSLLLLLGAGTLAGTMNGLAGGGTFVALPAMIAAGLSPVAANASVSLALYPGGATSAWVYRRGLGTVCGLPLKPLLWATLVGGLCGALLLLYTPTTLFDRVLPWLLLAATLAMAFGRRAGALLRARFRAGPRTVVGLQFVLGIYGGYFGGAMGLMMMAIWGLLDGAEIKTLNAARAVMVVAANTTAILCFVAAGAIVWPETVTLGAGALAGGYAGAWLGLRLPEAAVRAGVVSLAVAMTAAFFLRAYF